MIVETVKIRHLLLKNKLINTSSDLYLIIMHYNSTKMALILRPHQPTDYKCSVYAIYLFIY